ncbi:permease [Thiospirochaeta perfilievii]|uniref:Permease n=1 Tax=Thiospirochaeta perfilievii TaxID=252967 RepID=A0A5C1QD60_9SPIO|nr:permease [Thiospirochaeta perfilievii]QEN05347.1 permease [Thiospirochaeta perfilievii]
MTTVIMIVLAVILLVVSIIKSRSRSKQAVQIAKKMFLGTIVEVAGVMAIVGLVLALLPPEIIKDILGGGSTILSTIYGALIGTLTIMPAFIAFPLTKSLYVSGAHLVSLAAFLTTLTMVGFATFPIEVRHFGKKFAIVRNSISFAMALIIAFFMGLLL